MEFIDFSLRIDVNFGIMTREQYSEFTGSLLKILRENPVDNKKLIDFLSIDKRPFALAEIQYPTQDEHSNIKN